MFCRMRWVPVLLLAAAGLQPAWAEPKNDAAQQAMRKAQGMLRQLNQEKAALQAENAGLQEQVKKLEGKAKDLETLQGEHDKLKSHAEALQGNKDALENRVAHDADRIQALSAKLRDTLAELQKNRSDNQLLVQAVKERSEWIESCNAKNKSLREADQALLEKYRDKSLLQMLAEPVTGVASVQTENDVQEFRFKLEDLQTIPFSGKDDPLKGDGEAGAEAPQVTSTP